MLASHICGCPPNKLITICHAFSFMAGNLVIDIDHCAGHAGPEITGLSCDFIFLTHVELCSPFPLPPASSSASRRVVIELRIISYPSSNSLDAPG
jgi:hypothetical protein